MPIYEYICRPCDQRFEMLRSISQANDARCPNCGSGEVTRLISVFAARSSTESSSSSSSCAGCSSSNCSSCGR